MRDRAYYETGKPFSPQPGVIYEHADGDKYRCLNYAVRVRRNPWTDRCIASVLPVMQCVTDRPKNWTFFAHDMKIYEDGCISWGYSSEIGFFPYEECDGDLEYVNSNLKGGN